MLQIGPLNLSSRLIVGTGRYVDYETMRACHEASETAMVTLAIRRVDLSRRERSILDFIDRETIVRVSNTAQARRPGWSRHVSSHNPSLLARIDGSKDRCVVDGSKDRCVVDGSKDICAFDG